MITGELKSQVDRVWEAFWTGGISNPISVIEQFTYLLFIKRLDELQFREERKAALTGKPITKELFTPNQSALRWSSFKNMDPETMYAHFTTPAVDGLSVFEHMKQVGEAGGVYAQFMSKAIFMIPTPRLLDQVVQMIDGINMEDRDTKGDLYEYMLGKIASAGTNGQFRTPRHIIKMMVEMEAPGKEEVICDPAAGTAGFLVAAGEYYREHYEEWFDDKTFRDHFNSDMFHGVELDETMARIGAMNLQLHGIENPNLLKNDALSESAGHLTNKYTLILANPPFKGSLDHDAVEKSILQTVKSRKSELLFLGLILRMLKPGGRCAVIVPDGVLFGSSKAHKQIREEIIRNHKLDAVISMPSGVFKPYAGVSTAILFFTKTGTGGTDKVWFYDMQADGYTLDDKRGETKDNDIQDIVTRYHNLTAEADRKRTDKSFLVPFADIQANDWDLSINRYKEVVYDEVTYAQPSVIIQDIKNLQEENKQKLLILEELLK